MGSPTGLLLDSSPVPACHHKQTVVRANCVDTGGFSDMDDAARREVLGMGGPDPKVGVDSVVYWLGAKEVEKAFAAYSASMGEDRVITNGVDSANPAWLKECADLEHEYDAYPLEKPEGSAALTGWPYNAPNNIDPPHYKFGKVECIDAIESALTPEEFRGYLKGTVFKYLWRERLKGQDESVKKAEWFLKRMVK